MPFYILSFVSLLLILTPFLLGGFGILPEKWNSFRNFYYIIFAIQFISLSFKAYRAHLKCLWERADEFVLKYKLIWILIGFYFLVFQKVLIHNAYAFTVHAIDFSYFDLMLKNSLEGRWFYSEACNCNHFGVHSTFILFLLSPLTYFFNSPWTTHLAHGLILWSASIALYKLANEYQYKPKSIFLILFAFFNYSYVARLLSYNFHIEVFYVPLFLWLFTFEKQRRSIAFILVSFLITQTKEDGAVYLASYCFFSQFFNKEMRYQKIAVIVIACAIFVFNVKWLIPLNRGESSYLLAGSSAQYGSTLTEFASGIFSNISDVLLKVFTGKWIKILIPFLFIPLFDKLFLLSTLPMIFIHAIAPSEQMNSLMLYYSAPFIPFLFLSSLRILKDRSSLLGLIAILCPLVGGGSLHFSSISSENQTFQEIKKALPADKSLCTQGSLFLRLGYKTKNEILSEKCLDQQLDFYLFNTQLVTYPYSTNEVQLFINKLLQDQNYSSKTVGNFIQFQRIQ